MAKKKIKSPAEQMNAIHKNNLSKAAKQADKMKEAQEQRKAAAEQKAKEAQELARKINAEKLVETETYKAEIKAYLESDQQFHEGYLLLTRFCTNRCLLTQIQRRGVKMQSKVNYELEKMLEKEIIKLTPIGLATKPQQKIINMANTINKLGKDAPTIETEITPEQRKEALDSFLKESGSGVDPDKLPDELKEAYDHACKYYHIFRHWHEVMKIAKTDEERAAALNKAKSAEEYKTKCWKQINTWVKDGKLPGSDNKDKKSEADKGDEVPADVAKKIMEAKSYITKMLKTLEKKQGAKYEEQKKKLQVRIDLLKQHNLVPKVHEKMLLKHGLISKD